MFRFLGKKAGPIPMWLLLLFSFLMLAACGDSQGVVTSGSSSGTPDAASHSGPAKVGDTITVNNVAATLVSVKPIAGDEFNQPKAGNEYIVVHIKLQNKGTDEQDYSASDFHIKSGSGNITDEEFVAPTTYTANNELGTLQKLAGGGSTEGDIIFQVPTGDHNAQLTWQPSFLGNDTENAWNLGL